jgi:hypothetical protein
LPLSDFFYVFPLFHLSSVIILYFFFPLSAFFYVFPLFHSSSVIILYFFFPPSGFFYVFPLFHPFCVIIPYSFLPLSALFFLSIFLYSCLSSLFFRFYLSFLTLLPSFIVLFCFILFSLTPSSSVSPPLHMTSSMAFPLRSFYFFLCLCLLPPSFVPLKALRCSNITLQ